MVRRSRSKKIIKAFTRERDTLQASLRVENTGPLSFAVQCRHCTDAPCIAACITGAMRRDPQTGAVVCDETRCAGCWSCIMVCPAGAVQRGREHKVVSKCDLCMSENTPVCVVNCPNEALVYEER
jgi:carbon-monoxide dehydrogenase iron sulfur subunit